MKKTLSIHLGRQLFTIEEDAYDRLKNYLSKLEASLGAETGASDILEDIEMRFAELLHSYLGETRKVVDLADIEKAISSLGEPEEISEEAAINENENMRSYQQATGDSDRQKRLYRDTDNSTVAGVCSGLAAYLGVDPVLIKIIFVLFGFMGFGVGLYIILWIIIPNAKTPSERLQMRGKPVTVDTLKEEIERAAHRLKDDSIQAAKKFQGNSDHITNRVKEIFGLIGKVFGVFMIIGALFWLTIFTLITSGVIDFFPTTGDQQYASLYEFLHLVAPHDSGFITMWWSILLIGFGSPLFAITIGSRLLLGKKTRFFTVNFIIFPAIIGIGIALGIISGVQNSRDFAVNSEVEMQHISGKFDALYIKELPHFTKQQRVFTSSGIDFIHMKNGRIQEHGVHIKYKQSNDSLFHVYQNVSANGTDRETSLRRSNHIEHKLLVEGQKLWVDPYFSFPSKDGLRDQEVEIVVEVPTGKKLYINGIEQQLNTVERNGIFYADSPFESWND
ncbi:MAG: PspC domain-containing protein [Fluviicola sp.]|jgi:phage shock protein PspC (stress-responsive transcriptional regulator)